jgi:shikimate kinase
MLETEFLNQIKNNAIIACGGGMPMHNDNMSIINKKGVSVYLKASAKNLASRLKNEKQHRPLITNKPDEKLEDYIKEDLQNRSSYYTLSHHTVSINNKTEDELLREVYALISTL